MSTTLRRFFNHALNAASLSLVVGLFVVTGALPHATAQPNGDTLALAQATTQPTKQARSRSARIAARGARVVRVAAAQRGIPYQYGASGPRAFDCSGLTAWAYRLGADEQLPHSSAAQKGRTRRVSARAARPGDLVFFYNRGRIYHVGIYAGRRTIWHAPYTGTRVRKERIWTRSVSYGRVR